MRCTENTMSHGCAAKAARAAPKNHTLLKLKNSFILVSRFRCRYCRVMVYMMKAASTYYNNPKKSWPTKIKEFTPLYPRHYCRARLKDLTRSNLFVSSLKTFLFKLEFLIRRWRWEIVQTRQILLRRTKKYIAYLMQKVAWGVIAHAFLLSGRNITPRRCNISSLIISNLLRTLHKNLLSYYTKVPQ